MNCWEHCFGSKLKSSITHFIVSSLFFFFPQYGCRVNPGACELQLTLAKCWAMEFPTLWLTLLPAAGGLGICSEELPVPGQGWSRSVFLCYLQAGLERAALRAERQESKLCYILQRGQRRKQDTAAVTVKGEKWAVYRTGGEESSKKHKKAFEWVGRGNNTAFYKPHSVENDVCAAQNKGFLIQMPV